MAAICSVAEGDSARERDDVRLIDDFHALARRVDDFQSVRREEFCDTFRARGVRCYALIVVLAQWFSCHGSDIKSARCWHFRMSDIPSGALRYCGYMNF